LRYQALLRGLTLPNQHALRFGEVMPAMTG